MSDASPTQRSSSVAYALGQLTGKVDALTDAQKEFTQTLGPRFSAVEGRLVKLEERQWLWMGGGVVILAIAGVIMGHPIH